MGVPPISTDVAAPTSQLTGLPRSTFTEETPPPGALVLLAFAVVAGLIVLATAGLTAAHGRGRLVDLFVLGAGLILAYFVGLRIAPLVAVALAATFIALEAHYGRLDGSHAASVVAFSIVFAAAALAAGALGDGFSAWNRPTAGAGPGPVVDEGRRDDVPPPRTVSAPPGEVIETESLDTLLDESIRVHGALSLFVARPDDLERIGAEHGQQATHAILDRVEDVVRGHLRNPDVLHRHGLFEFWAILPRTSLEATRTMAERIRLELGESPVELEDGSEILSALSLGIASCPIDGRTASGLRRAAARALAAAVEQGGNRTLLHSVPPGAPRGWGLAPEPDEQGSA